MVQAMNWCSLKYTYSKPATLRIPTLPNRMEVHKR